MRGNIRVCGHVRWLEKVLTDLKKSFDVVGEGDGVRIFNNSRGFKKSILFSKEDADWLMRSFR